MDASLNSSVYFPTAYALEHQATIIGRKEDFSSPYRACAATVVHLQFKVQFWVYP